MKKRKNASLKHMTKDERRRHQLHKSTAKQTGANNRSNRVMFARSNGSTIFVRSESTVAKTPFSKRMLALILAIVFVLSVVPTAVFFHLRGKADDIDVGTATVHVRVENDDTQYEDVQIAAGSIADNVKNVKVDGLPDGAEFVRAVVVNGDYETEIKAIGALNGDTYYSTSDSADTGSLKSNHEEIYLVYAIKYWINESDKDETKGSYIIDAHFDEDAQRYYIWANEDLTIKKIQAKPGYSVDTVSYSSAGIHDSITISDNSVSIPAEDIKGDVNISIPFEAVSKYSIIDVSYTKGLGNGGTAQTRGSETISAAQYNGSYFRTRWAPESAAPGSDTTFYLYSNSSSGGSNFQLNMLRINGIEVDVSEIDTNGAHITIPDGSDEGTQVTVRYVGSGIGMYWLDNCPNPGVFQSHDRDVRNWTANSSGTQYTASGWRKNRTIYEVSVEKIGTNLQVEYNFKEKANREVIIKGLRGIEQTGHAIERRSNGLEYYFETQNSNVYPAYYYETAGVPSANLYLYRVKEGYNPYTVLSPSNPDSYMCYVSDNGTVARQDGAVLSGYAVGRPEEAIVNATAGIVENGDSSWAKFNTSYRKWGGHDGMVPTDPDLINKNNRTNGWDFVSGEDFVLTSIGKDNNPIWYGVALQQNNAKNQQLYLNARPYEFHMELDLQGGNLAGIDSDYSSAVSGHEGYWVENDTHTIEENSTLFLPEQKPVKSGSVFLGWQLQIKDSISGDYKDVVPLTLFQKADAITIDQALKLVSGKEDDQYIRVKALWEEVSEDSDYTKVAVTVFRQVPSGTTGAIQKDGKYYVKDYESEEPQLANKQVVLLNYHTPSPSQYYTQRTGTYVEGGETYKYTKTTTRTTSMSSETDPIPESNQLRVYNDYRTVSFSVEKVVKGKTQTTEFPITVTFTPDNGFSEIDLAQAKSMIEISTGKELTEENGSLSYTRNYYKGDKVDFVGVPYGWTYSVSENPATVDGDYTSEISPEASARLLKDTAVQVINRGANPGLETEKTLDKNANDDTYKITLGAYATGDTISEGMKRSVPTDFAIVVDQSGSMSKDDVGEQYLSTGVKSWTVTGADSASTTYYVKHGDEYCEVYSKNGPLYTRYSHQNINNAVLGRKGWQVGYHYYGTNNDFYVLDNDQMYYLFFRSNGLKGLFVYVANLFYVKNANYNGNSVNEAKTLYENSSPLVEKVTVSGHFDPITIGIINTSDPEDYSNSATFKYQRDATGGGDVRANTMYIDVPVYTQNSSDGPNSLFYKTSDGVEHQLGNKVWTADDQAYAGVLYTKKKVTRMESLQDSVKEFVSTIAQNAYETGVDHRVALIGFANNQMPDFADYSTAKANGSNGIYDYMNTGLYFNGSFKNYETVENSTDYRATTEYTNVDYYIVSNNTWIPVLYDTENNQNRWYRIDTGAYVTPAWYDEDARQWWYHSTYDNNDYYWTGADGGNHTSGGRTYGTNIFRFYDPEFKPLSDQNYKDALVSANQEGSANINSDLQTEINMFKAQGGTYTSYGIAMANNVFEHNSKTYTDSDGNTRPRKRVILVFSDGAPGANGYEETIAKEALADSAISKATDGSGAEVYTIYLYGSSEGKNETAETFMKQLSSDYTVEKENVYDLDPAQKYYYTEDGKTYSVSADSTKLYVWIENGIGGYSLRNPSSVTLYSDTSLSQESRVTNPVVGTKYWINNSGTAQEVYYGYKWYNSNGRIREPMTSAEDPAATAEQYRHWQFFTVTEPTDNQTNKYSFTADNANVLENVFETINETMEMTETEVTLDETSILRDVITPNFVIPSPYNFKAFTEAWNGEEWSDELVPFEAEFLEPVIDDKGNTIIDVKNFDYAANYIAPGHPGQKLIVTIDGLTLKEGKTGTLYSNTTDSGIYKTEEDDSKTMVVDFPMPNPVTVDPLKANVTLHFSGTYANTSQTFPVTFKLTNSAGEPYSGTFGDLTFSSAGEVRTTLSNGISKELTDIPPNAKLTVTVTDSEDTTKYYTYVLKDVDSGMQLEDNVKEGIYDITAAYVAGNHGVLSDTREIEINITDNTRKFTVINLTEPRGDGGDYANRSKEFPIKLELKDAENHKVNTIVVKDENGRDVEFENGELTVWLADQKSKSYYLPDGYSIIVKDAESAAPYDTTYEHDRNVNVTVADDDEYSTASLNNGDATAVVLHTIIAPEIEGLTDSDNHNIIIYILAGVAAISAGAGAAYVYRKKDEFVEQ